MNSCRNFNLGGKQLLQDAFLRLFKIGASFVPPWWAEDLSACSCPNRPLCWSRYTGKHLHCTGLMFQHRCQDIFTFYTWQEEVKICMHAFGMLVLSCLCHLRQSGLSFKGLSLKTLVMYNCTDQVKLTGARDKPLPAGASELQNDK